MHYKKEIPYAVEVDTEEFFEEETIIRIRSVIIVERKTQKGIIIGHKGSVLKRVGTVWIKASLKTESNCKRLCRIGQVGENNSKKSTY